ncbi:hypothetical protein CEXT_804741 [Caerostris extrusa]|uniref:Uncharacterized protein n=1 Tax=Caerostris extrusa TaxID=172846 RepID=A0AAV4Y163_CAEEX|nr:hypothetical protein CEXT_804741 [Caerostris extrusa]
MGKNALPMASCSQCRLAASITLRGQWNLINLDMACRCELLDPYFLGCLRLPPRHSVPCTPKTPLLSFVEKLGGV